MALPLCGAGTTALWAPYASQDALEGYVRKHLQPITPACDGVCTKNQVPTTVGQLSQCGQCAKQHVGWDRFYGCTWCYSILAPLAAHLNGKRQPTWVDVQEYLNDTNRRILVKKVWDKLSQCEQGSWVKKTCLIESTNGFPLEPEASNSGSSNKHTLAIVLSVTLSFVILVIVGLLIWNKESREFAKRTLKMWFGKRSLASPNAKTLDRQVHISKLDRFRAQLLPLHTKSAGVKSKSQLMYPRYAPNSAPRSFGAGELAANVSAPNQSAVVSGLAEPAEDSDSDDDEFLSARSSPPTPKRTPKLT